MRIAVIISVAFLLSIACGNSQQKDDMPQNGFNAWKILSDTNFLVRWERTGIKAIDSIAPVLLEEGGYSQEMINDLKANIREGKNEEVVKGKKVYGSHKWLLNKLNGYKEQLDTTVCNSIYIVELTQSGEVTESTNWIILFLNNDCRLVLTFPQYRICQV